MLLFLEAIHMLYLLLAWYGNAGTRLFDAVGTINQYQLGLKEGQSIYRQLTQDCNDAEVTRRRWAIDRIDRIESRWRDEFFRPKAQVAWLSILKQQEAGWVSAVQARRPSARFFHAQWLVATAGRPLQENPLR